MVNYFADHELAAAGLESSMFANLDNVRDYKPGAPNPYDVMAAHLDGSDPSRRIGTAIALSVMAGDKFDISATSYFASDSVNMQSSVNPNDMMNAIISALAGGVDGYNQEATNMNAVDAMFSSGNYLGMYQTLLDSIADYTRPLAFINYQVYDAQMNLIPSQSGAIQVSGTADSWQVIGTANPISITQNGYLSVYMSNADYMPVYMDKLNIAYYKGRLVQEQHYYPFGLSINEGTASGITNQYQYQGKKLQDELGLDLYDFHARQYDAQIGRFWGVDPADQFPSGYTGQGNDPANNIDPTDAYVRGPKSPNGQRSIYFDYQYGSDSHQVGNDETFEDLDIPGESFIWNLSKGASGFIDADDLTMYKGTAADVGIATSDGASDAQTSSTKTSTADGANPDEKAGDGNGGGGSNPNANMNVSKQGIAFIKSWENYSSDLYDANSPTGDWTIGWGHKFLKGETMPSKITPEEAERLFESDLQKRGVDQVLKYVTVPLNQHEFDALVSYVFNSGSKNVFKNTQFIKYLNSGDYKNAGLQMDIITGGGKVLPGLVQRRQDEKNIWFNNTYDNH